MQSEKARPRIRVTDPRPPAPEPERHCQRCGVWRESLVLRKTTFPDPVNGDRSLTLELCSACRKAVTP